MKKQAGLIILFACLITHNLNLLSQVAINTTGANPDPSAMLDVSATDKGMLIPRLSTAQRNAITTPATGLMVYDNDTNSFWFFDGTVWTELISGTSSMLSDADGDTHIQVEESPDEDIIRMDIAGKEMVKIDSIAISTDFNGKNVMVGDFAGFPVDGKFNVAMGVLAGYEDVGDNNTFVGYDAGGDGIFGTGDGGDNNTLIGAFAGSGVKGNDNTVIGANTYFQTWGPLPNAHRNTVIGASAGNEAGVGSDNIFIGYHAGSQEYGSNKLYIENTNSSMPLIYGDFLNDSIRIFGSLSIGQAYTFPTADGTAGQVLATDGAGNTSWQSMAATTTLLEDADQDTKIQVEENADEDIIRMDLGGDEGLVVDRTASNPWSLPYFYPRIVFKNNNGNILIGAGNGEHLDDGQTLGYGAQNTLVGEGAGANLGPSYNNTALGYQALGTNDAVNNTAIGFRALWGNNSFADNTALGTLAGVGTSGAGNLYLGMSAGNGLNTNNRLFIDVDLNTTIGKTTHLIYGEFDNDRVAVNWDFTTPIPQTFSVNGDASKAVAGAWLANSDARLKTDIEYMNSEEMLDQVLRMKGATYLWNDDKTGTRRPTGTQYGFIAQDLQKVWPEKVSKDGQGYLMAAYGDYDPMFVEAIKALHAKIEILEAEVKQLRQEKTLQAQK